MADRIKGITIELDGDTTKLTDALKSVNKEIRSTQSELRDVNKLLKLDPGNSDLLGQKYKYLGTEIEATKKKLDQLKEAQKQMSDAGNVDTAQYDALQREIEETEQKLKSLTKEYENFGSVSAQSIAAAGDKVQQVGEKISGAGTKMSTAITLPVVAGATAAVNAYGDVDKQFNLVKQTMGDTANTAEDFSALWNQIGESAKASIYGMSDATEATLNFARQGFNAVQAADMLTPAMDLAAGTGTELSEVTSGLGNVLKMFGADSSEASNYADVLAKAQAQANTTTSQLFEAMSIAGPICKTVGWDVKDLAAITDVFGNASISGSEGANALKTGLARLAAPAKDGAETMEALGLATGQTYAIFNEDGTLKSMPEVIQNLNSAFSGLTDQEKLSAASSIFGKNQMSKWLTLIQTSPEEVSGLRDALDDVSGSANNMSTALMSGTGGTIEQLKSTFDVLSVTIGELVAPAFQRVFDSLINIMNGIMSLDPATQQFILTLVGVAAAIGPILITVGKMATGIGAVMKLAPEIVSFAGKIKSLGSVFSKLWGVLSANPILIVIAAVAALVAGFIHLWNTSEEFRNFWIGLWEKIKDIVGKAVDGVKGFFGTLGTFFTNVGDKAGEMKEAVSQKFSDMKASIEEHGGGIKGVLFTAVEEYKNIWSKGFEIINQLTGGKLGEALSAVQDKMNSIKSKFSDAMDTTKSTVKGALEKISGFFSGLKLELPKFKLPHFSLSGTLSLKPPSVPHISVDWYKKAIDDAYILNSPTIFGMNGGKLFGGGEAGSEAVVGTDKLAEIVRSAVAGINGGTTIIPVYIGQERIDEIVVKAAQRNNYRSGGR